jgi:hypothetical protein
MISQRLPLLILISLVSSFVFGQTRGGSGPRGVDPATNARNAAVLGTRQQPLHRPSASASDEPKVEFHSQTVLTQVPVVVTDKSGNHLHGLNKEDFTVLENGKPISVANFEELTASNAQFTIPPTPSGQFRNLTLDGPQPRNVVVIALDTVNTPFLDQTYGWWELVKFLARNLDSGQVFALADHEPRFASRTGAHRRFRTSDTSSE